jgi:hypothetical protein
MGLSTAPAQPPPGRLGVFGPVASPGPAEVGQASGTLRSNRPAAAGHGESPRGLVFARVLQSKLGATCRAIPSVGTVPLAVPGSRHGATGTARCSDREEDDVLLPTFRQTAQLAPPSSAFPLEAQASVQGAPSIAGAAGAPAPEGPSPASLEDLLPALVRKIAWSGDARRGSVRLELGAGPLSGGTLLVRADGGQVHVALHAPPGTDVEDWRARIATRLAARGLDVTAVDVE